MRDHFINPPGVEDILPQTIIVRRDANGNVVPKFVWEQGDLRPNPAWFRAPTEERVIIGATAYLKIAPETDDLHATCS